MSTLNTLIRTAFALCLFIFISSRAAAQREVMLEQYVQNPIAINPAFTGVRGDFNMTAIFRRKWFTIRNSPASQTFAADGTIADGKIGLGFQALNDQTSSFTTTAFSGSFAYHLSLSDTWKLGLGAQGGINVLPIADFTYGGTNRALASVGVGAWLRSDQFYAGISKPELLAQQFGNQAIASFYRRPLYVMVGGSVDLNPDVMMLPHLLIVQEKDHDLRADFGARFWFYEKLGLGASYRIGGGYNSFSAKVDYLQLTAELQLGKNVRLGYFYSTRQAEQIYANYTGPKGIHELMLKFIPNPAGFQKY